ncbi:MAG: hypothetical protein WCX97_04775 [Candidatus Magasanikbacteria bacterium]
MSEGESRGQEQKFQADFVIRFERLKSEKWERLSPGQQQRYYELVERLSAAQHGYEKIGDPDYPFIEEAILTKKEIEELGELRRMSQSERFKK